MTEKPRGPAAAATAALEAIEITKRFGSIVACDGVSLAVQPGEIHGLLGQNGAGKSTLMNIFIGLVQADAGEVRLFGEPVDVEDPVDAAAQGLAMVHQHFSLIEPLTVWENVALGDSGRIDQQAVIDAILEIGEQYSLPVDPLATVAELTAGQRQRIEIIKALRRHPRLFILDEPTSVLTLAESRELFDVLRVLVSGSGSAVILISHKLDEILHATDQVTIMRDGRVVASMPTAEANAPLLAREMVGRDVSLRSEASAIGLIDATAAGLDEETEHGRKKEVRPALELRSIHAQAADRRTVLDGLNLVVLPGEIVGLAGVEGNGQDAISRLCSGLLSTTAGSVFVEGEPIVHDRAGAMLAAGVSVVPADRHGAGCVLEMTVAENLVFDSLESVSKRGMIDRRQVAELAERLIENFSIVTPSADAPLSSLSGGNQQRVVLARELSRPPRVLIAEQPTAGLDVGAQEEIADRLKQAAADGIGVLLISTELEELLALSDRIAVIFRGRIVGQMDRHEIDLERLGLLMGGRAT